MSEKQEQTTFKMKNLGEFYEVINKKLQDKSTARKKAKDPYEQWNYAEQVKLLSVLLEEYKVFMRE